MGCQNPQERRSGFDDIVSVVIWFLVVVAAGHREPKILHN